jgi:hypothetical protein
MAKVKKAQPKAQEVKPLTLKKARALCAKGFSVSYEHEGISVMLTPENYKQPLSKRVAERLAYDAAHEAKFAKLGKCQCPSHMSI